MNGISAMSRISPGEERSKVSDDARIHLRIDSLAPALLQRVASRDRFLDGRFEIDTKLSLGVGTERRAREQLIITPVIARH